MGVGCWWWAGEGVELVRQPKEEVELAVQLGEGVDGLAERLAEVVGLVK